MPAEYLQSKFGFGIGKFAVDLYTLVHSILMVWHVQVPFFEFEDISFLIVRDSGRFMVSIQLQPVAP